MPEEFHRPPVTANKDSGVTMRIEIPPELINRRQNISGASDASTDPGNPVGSPQRVTPQAGEDFQQLLQNLYDAAFITDEKGQVLMANPRADHAFLAAPGQLCQNNILSLISGADEPLLQSIRETLQSNRFVLMQVLCLRTDGTTFPAEISVNPLHLGTQARMSFFVRDVTVRMEQEEKLRAGNTAMQNASSGIAIADIRGRIEFCNPAFADFFGLSDVATAAGLDLRELIRAPGRIEEILEQTARGQTWDGDFELVRPSGELFHAQASIIANLDTDGNPTGIVVSLLDITSQKQAQQKLEEFTTALRIRNAQMQEELDLAGELQVALLPATFKTLPDGADAKDALMHFQHLYCPNGRIGGDFCHIRELSPTEASLLIVDVMGHGVRSALVVATIRGLLEELRPLARDPGGLLTQLNKNFTTVFQRLGVDMTFATAFYAVMDAGVGRLKYANAGHPIPYLLCPSEATLHHLPAPEQRTAALGILGGMQFVTMEQELAPQDTLLLYTDGLAEAQAPSNEFFMDSRMEEVLRENLLQPPTRLLKKLLHEARNFSELATLDDDVCLVAMQFIRSVQPTEPVKN